MQEWQIPLLVAAGVFAAFMVYRVRPAFLSRERWASREALRAARARVEAAKDATSRALALSDAGDAAARAGSATSANGFYLRAMREDPTSPEIVARAAAALARHPRSLESLLWRRLANEEWTGEGRAAAVAALKHLVALYTDERRHAVRAKALEHAIAALEPHT
jgi:hypothetical protein